MRMPGTLNFSSGQAGIISFQLHPLCAIEPTRAIRNIAQFEDFGDVSNAPAIPVA